MCTELRERTIAALKADPDLAALRRSLDIYYGDPVRESAMDRLYGRFIRPGDLAIDIGSHVGDRIASFRRLGARVVALEPQPDCARVIRALYGSDPTSGADRIGLRCAPGQPDAAGQFRQSDREHGIARVRAGGRRAPAGWDGQSWDRRDRSPRHDARRADSGPRAADLRQDRRRGVRARRSPRPERSHSRRSRSSSRPYSATSPAAASRASRRSATTGSTSRWARTTP